MKAPQIIYLLLMASGLVLSLVKHGEDRGKYDFRSTCISVAITLGLLLWGGFFK